MKTKVLQVKVSGENLSENLVSQWLVDLIKATDSYTEGDWEPELIDDEKSGSEK
jgi:hypothetical protein